jgi:hypothetical protein
MRWRWRSTATEKDEKTLSELQSHFESLTPREREVIGFGTAGMMNKGRGRNGGYRNHREDPPWSYHAKGGGTIPGGSGEDGGNIGGSPRTANSLSHCKPKYYTPPHLCPINLAPHSGLHAAQRINDCAKYARDLNCR